MRQTMEVTFLTELKLQNSMKNKEQVYGTQVAGRKIGESDEWFQFVWPIKNPERVNERRIEMGFDSTVEENAKRLDVEYHVYSLKQIDSILNPQ